MIPAIPNENLSSVDDLEALLEMLYPDPPLVDILTLKDFKFRYPFSGLGAGAVAAMERAQRVTRAIGNYEQMALSEFYNGLIYLYSGQFLGALPAFAEARRYWDFEDQTPAVCLAYFAQGVAQQGAYHYERALSQYGKAEKRLAQFPVDDLTGGLGAYWRALRGQLAASRQSLLRQMRHLEEGTASDGQARRIPIDTAVPSPPATPADGETPTPIMTQTPERRPSSTPIFAAAASRATADLPIFNLTVGAPLAPGSDEKTEPQADLGGETAVPPPAVHTAVPATVPATVPAAVPAATTPLPAHQNLDNHLIWVKPNPASWPEVRALFPDISTDAHILVDRRISQYPIRHGDLVIVDDEVGAGIVPVQAEQPPLATHYPSPIFLGKIESPPPLKNQDVAAMGANQGQGSVRLSPDEERPLYVEDIIGIVIGIWVGLKVRQQPTGSG